MTKTANKAGHRGFTLIELMIVVAIIGILAAVAIPKFAEMIRKSKEGATKGSLSSLRSALTIYISDNEGKPVLSWSNNVYDGGEIVVSMVPKYVENMPTAKLGSYHLDNNSVGTIVMRTPFDGNRSSAAPVTAIDSNVIRWFYTSIGDGYVWVNCSHSDTKGDPISGW